MGPHVQWNMPDVVTYRYVLAEVASGWTIKFESKFQNMIKLLFIELTMVS